MKRRYLVLPAAVAAAALLGSSAAAPSGMVKIPGGTFAYGSDSADIPALVSRWQLSESGIVSPEAPQYQVTMKPFWLDRAEVTVYDFAQFVIKDTIWLPQKDSGKISNGDYLKPWRSLVVPTPTDSLPVTYVTWFAARSYCKHQGKRLPTEVEWEYAARGGLTGDVFPWGDSLPDTTKANYDASAIGHPVDVHHYPPNGYGLFDMAGNVWEFTADQWTDPREKPGKGPVLAIPWSKQPERVALERVVVRGGAFDSPAVTLRVRYRDSHPIGGADANVGFRCAKDY